MTDEFLLADNSDDDPTTWTAVEDLLADSTDITLRALEWEYRPFATTLELSDGSLKGMGFPVVKWTFRALRELQRENLRDFCTGLSANVYIRTPTNEFVSSARVWKDFLCKMYWQPAEEIVGVNAVEDVVIEFRFCKDVT